MHSTIIPLTMVTLTAVGLATNKYHANNPRTPDKVPIETIEDNTFTNSANNYAEATAKHSNPTPRTPVLSEHYQHPDLDILSRMIWGEARGCNDETMIRMGYTAINRQSKGWDSDLRTIILKPEQYSCFNPDDVNKEKVWNAEKINPAEWERSKEIAEGILRRTISDPSGGATSYRDPTSPSYEEFSKDATIVSTGKTSGNKYIAYK